MAGYTQRALARAVGVSDASISRWENGVNPPGGDIAELLDRALKAEGELLRAWRQDSFGVDLPVWQQKVGLLQERSLAIDWLSPVLVAGMLQTKSYARLVFKDGQPLVADAEIDRWVAARCGRLEVLLERRPDLTVTAVFPHSALTCVPDDVRKEQASHLMRLMRQDGVNVHLLPQGVYMLGVTAPVQLFRLEDQTVAVASDHIAGNAILENSSHLRVEALVRRCLASAMPSGGTRRMLKELAE